MAGRFAACKPLLYPEKTKIVYCKVVNRQRDYLIIGDRAAHARVVHSGQLGQEFVAAVLQLPAADCPPGVLAAA